MIGENDQITRDEQDRLVKENMIIIGRNIRFLRESHNMTRENLAYHVEADRSYIYRIETDPTLNLTLKTIVKICKVFDKKIYEIFIELDPAVVVGLPSAP